MAADRLAGMEVEYGFAVRLRGVALASRQRYLGALMEAAADRLTALPGSRDGGLFLANGGRLYVDTGQHVEWCTPEVSDPEDVVRYVKAGDRLLAELARTVEGGHSGAELRLFRCNVDYASGSRTWGHHESYAHRAARSLLHRQLLSFLASRIVVCGSGGLNPSLRGIEFSLSPRAMHLRTPVSNDSTNDRGMLNDRNEPLCGNGWSRLHLICGDGLSSPVSLRLQLSTTTLAVALIEHRLAPQGLQLVSPVRALHTFARDPGLAATVPAEGGKTLTAVEIQRAWLVAAEQAARHPLMPEWTADACARWRQTLDALERAADDHAGGLDWRIKRVLFRRVLGESGLRGPELRFWNRFLADRVLDLQAALGAQESGELVSTSVEAIAPSGAVARDFPEVRAAGRTWDELARLLRVRARLCELDLRWGELGGAGIFDRLVRSGVLPDAAADPPGVAEAIDKPPARGRAHLRGMAIRRLAESKRRHGWAGWDRVVDTTSERRLDLADPLVSREVWLSSAADRTPRIGSPPETSRQRNLWERLGREFLDL